MHKDQCSAFQITRPACGFRVSPQGFPQGFPKRPALSDGNLSGIIGVGGELRGCDDTQLLARARAGDSHAFDEFVERHTPHVYRWMAQASGAQDAEDLTQEVFFRAFRGLARFRGEAPPRAWLASIAHNIIKNRYRFLHRFRRIFSPGTSTEAIPDPPAVGGDPESAATDSQTRSFVAEAMKALPEEFRMPVVLRDLEGWNYEEIGVSLRLPVGTVKSRIARGRGQLKDILAPLLRRRKDIP